MPWLRGAFTLGNSPSRRPKEMDPKARPAMAKDKRQLPVASSSDDPSPFDSASQYRVSRDSDSGSSMFSSPAPSAIEAGSSPVITRLSISTASDDVPSPFDSSSEPSTGITTPSSEGQGKLGLGNPSSMLQQEIETPPSPPTSGPLDGCAHRETMITDGSNLVCTACGNWGLKRVFVCIDVAEKRGKRRVPQTSDVGWRLRLKVKISHSSSSPRRLQLLDLLTCSIPLTRTRWQIKPLSLLGSRRRVKRRHAPICLSSKI